MTAILIRMAVVEPIDFRLTLFTRTLFGFIFFLFALIL